MRIHRPKWMYPTTVESVTVWTLALFGVCYLAAIISVQRTAWRDPTSIFFQPSKAFTPRYSNLRWRQSEAYLLDAADHAPHSRRNNETVPEICIGIPSVARKGVRYLRSTLGSLLAGLEDYERDQIYIIIFFADLDPNDHPAYHEPNIKDLADEILVYDLPDSELDQVRHFDSQHKGVFDYRYVLNACYQTGAPFVTLLEDDVLAVDGWYPKTISGLENVERFTDREGGKNDWLYLRLFYTERYLGWNGEDAVEHTLWSVAIIILAAVVLFCTRAFSSKAAPYLPHSLILSVCCICIPLCITFFFLAGRVTLFPPTRGVHKMEDHGCCSQGLVFNRKYTPELLNWLRDYPSGLFFDMRVEKYADEHPHLHRWAISPPVIQHTGMKSSSDEPLKAEVAEKIWSFEFEMYDPDELLEAKKWDIPRKS